MAVRSSVFFFFFFVVVSMALMDASLVEAKRAKISLKEDEKALSSTLVPPTQINIAFAGEQEGTGMSISWFTTSPTNTSTVMYGQTSGSYAFQAQGYFTNYFKDAYAHHVVLTGLAPATQYYYVAGDPAGGFSTEYTFTTAPAAQVPFSVAVYGDLGLINGNQTRKALVSTLDQFDWHFHVGDYAYADDGKEANFESTWNLFQEEMEPIAAVKAYMTCPGNHEASCHDTGEFSCPEGLKNFTSYRNRFRMPASESGAQSNNMWYSFNYSYVHFVSIDTETDYPDAPEGRGTLWNSGPFGNQIAWLEADLAAADSARQNGGPQTWLIVIGHRPLYSTVFNDYPFFAREHLRAAVEDLLYKYHVDFYISGHVHSYERLLPVYKGELVSSNYDQPKATSYVVIGNAGNVEVLTKYWDPITPRYLAFRNSDCYGFASLSVLNATTLTWTAYDSADMSVIDEFTLVRGSPW